jgi:hypothetical protein
VVTVAVASSEFAALADRVAHELRFPEARRIVVPHPIGGTPAEELDRRADAAIDALLRVLDRG